MLIAHVLAAAIKPALVGAAITASAAGGFAAWQYTQGDGATAFQRVQSAGQRLLISEFAEDADTIVAIDPADPQGARTQIARIGHAPGYGIFAALSPAGDAIAYTALPADTSKPAPDAPAIAAIVEDDGDVVTLATDIDLLIPPIWSPDGASIVVRKNTPAANSAGRFELILLGRDGSRSTITSWSSAAVFPIAFSPDGAALYFATLDETGVDLYSVAPDGAAETKIAHLSDDIARDWKLSPDGSTLAYSVALSGAQPRVVTMTLDLATAVAAEAVAKSAGAEFNPAWRPDGELTIASVDAQGGGAVSVDATGATEQITGNDGAIDLPLGWSPDGATLAVRTIEGATPFEAGESHLELVTQHGGRERISDSADVLIVGWME